MSLEKNFKKMLGFKNGGFLLLCLAVIFLAILINDYSCNKSKYGETMLTANNRRQSNNNSTSQDAPQPKASSAPFNQQYSSANNLTTTNQDMSKDCDNKSITQASDLLPNSTNNSLSNLNPNNDNSSLQSVNLLNAGYHIGTVSQSLRNANLQLRSDPSVPTNDVGPWNNTTIAPDPSAKMGYQQAGLSN